MFFRAIISAFFCFLLISSCAAQDTTEHPAGNYPGEAWYRYESPEEAGWSSEKIEDALAYADSLGSEAIMLIHKGVVVTQWGDLSYHESVASIRKAFQSALFGIYVSDGTVDLNATLSDLQIDDINGLTTEEKKARVADLLTMRSGVYHPAATESENRTVPDRGSHDPGAVFFYYNWNVNALNTIFNRVTGTTFIEAFYEQIARPLEMQDFGIGNSGYWYNPAQSRHPSWIVRMSTRDMARFGLLFLREGQWKGEQIIPKEWIRESTRVQVKVGEIGFGYMWWIPDGRLADYDTFTASGAGNQSIMVLPELDLVFVHRAMPFGGGVSGLDAREILFRLIDARVHTGNNTPGIVPLQNND